MACEVVPTQTFEREYDRILAYHVEELRAPKAARSLVNALDKACALLADNPGLGAISTKPTLETLELREWIVRNYIIVYRLDNDRIFLEHMFHQSQNFETLV